MHELEFFGKFGSRGTSLMLNTFSFGAWVMVNFEVEVWKFQHVENFPKCKVIYLNIPPYLTFYVSFK
jgi:hypothetical protein